MNRNGFKPLNINFAMERMSRDIHLLVKRMNKSEREFAALCGISRSALRSV